MKKLVLNTALRQVLAQRGVSQALFAVENRLDFDPFRTQLSRNRFSDSALTAIARVLGRPVDSLHEVYEFQTTRRERLVLSPLAAILKMIARGVKVRNPQSLRDIRALYGSLESGDLVVVMSPYEPPLECTVIGWAEMGDTLAAAVQKGVKFIYVQPKKKTLGIFRGMMPEVPFPDAKEQHEQLLQNLDRKGVGDSAKDGTVLWQPGFCPFWCVGMQFIFCTAGSVHGSRSTKLFARVHFGNGSSEDLFLSTTAEVSDARRSYLIQTFVAQPTLRKFRCLL